MRSREKVSSVWCIRKKYIFPVKLKYTSIGTKSYATFEMIWVHSLNDQTYKLDDILFQFSLIFT